MSTPDLTQTVVPEFCPYCDSTGLVLTGGGYVDLCANCGGTGRRMRHAYEPGRGEQGDDESYLTKKPPEGGDHG